MSKSSLFSQAHALCKSVIQAGDDYRITFGACLKLIIKESKMIKDNSDAVVCWHVPSAINRARIYWVEGKKYQVTRRTKASFWVVDELGFERRFNATTGGCTGYKEEYKVYMVKG